MNRAPLACSRYTSTRRCGTSISTRSTDHGVVTPSSCRYNSMLSIASPPLGDCATAYQLPRRPTPNPDGPVFIYGRALVGNPPVGSTCQTRARTPSEGNAKVALHIRAGRYRCPTDRRCCRQHVHASAFPKGGWDERLASVDSNRNAVHARVEHLHQVRE